MRNALAARLKPNMEQGTPNAGREEHSLAEAQRPVCFRTLTDMTRRKATAEEERKREAAIGDRGIGERA